jgi:hypothetical protein
MLAAVVAMALLVSSHAFAAKGHSKPFLTGRVTAVDSNSITVQHHKGTPMTFTVNSTAKVFVKGKASTLAKVRVGMHARVRSADGTTAAAIHARRAHHHKKKAATST